jgi:phosphoglucomutase
VVETAKYLFEEKLGFKNILWINDKNLPDFGGKKHPNPEPQYSPELMDAMKSGKVNGGFAFDPDADRFMFVGKGGFVLSAQYLGAICLENDNAAFNGRKITGVGSSMPTASAMILVAIRKGIKYFITPTGWKFFSTLMDKLLIQFAEEESRGHSSDHTREKSGPETALRMLQLEAKTGKSVETLVKELWTIDGRVFDLRIDYEKIPMEEAEKLKKLFDQKTKEFSAGGDLFGYQVTKAEIYKYTDPTNGEVADNEGWIFYGENNSRLIFRFSGTDTTATMRVYAEKPDKNFTATEEEILESFFVAAEKLSGQKRPHHH